MKRYLVAALCMFMVVFFASPALAAPTCQQVLGLGSICLNVQNGRATVDGLNGLVHLDAPAPVQQLPPVIIPGPTVTVTPPAATVTRTTTTNSTVTATRSAPPVTISASPTGQDVPSSATLSDNNSQPRVSSSPPRAGGGIHILPRTPGPALAAGTGIGLLLGILLGLFGLFYTYRKGRRKGMEEGEEATLSEFLGVLRRGRETTER